MRERIVGLDLGAETVKVAEVIREGDRLRRGRTWLREHRKDPAGTLRRLLPEIGWDEVTSAAVTGRMARTVCLDSIPFGVAVAEGLHLLHPELDGATVVSIGGHGFSVTDVGRNGNPKTRENSRCSQGTGNFLRQLVERLDLDLPEADELCETAEAAPLSGRCPVILKTDLTHLANKGVEKGRILAGLYDAVCENVQSLIRPNDAARHLMLIGGLARSDRIRRNFRDVAEGHGLTFLDGDAEADRFLEAFGTARVAAQRGCQAPSSDALLATVEKTAFRELESFQSSLSRVHRMNGQTIAIDGGQHDVILGLDIGSTGSKGLAIDVETRKLLWEHYTNTLGDPVGAAQRIVAAFLDESESRLHVRAVGATGSGREIVGSLLASCFGVDLIFVLNEIAAHAAGALYFDRDVDTIFEIGGQDAKYVRLDAGRICDAAMNEACSAGTGSFIEEQGSKFDGIEDVVQMGRIAMETDSAVSLGQHCSVFMAEIIDQAVAAGIPNPRIVAGIYDSVIQNYLNRVKGSRSIGNRIFCQGMPFMSDALAAAVARRTGRDVVVPPNPGTIGALGIALLARDELRESLDGTLDLGRFLEARVDAKEQFVCGSTKGCGGAGNACRIDRLRVTVEGKQKKFVWGGSCSLYDRGSRKRKLPDLSPNPFKERETLIDSVIAEIPKKVGRPRIALTDEFSLKGLFPFFATFLSELGLDLEILRGGARADLKNGIQLANVPFCAPVQLYHGVAAKMLATDPDWLFVPLIKELPRADGEQNSQTCPLVQGIPSIIDQALLREHRTTKLLDPLIEMCADNFESATFRRLCRDLADRLGARKAFERAFQLAVEKQQAFATDCRGIGERAIAFAREHDLPAVVVLGRAYTIYNDVLNSNVPNLLRDLGALAVPVDCYSTEGAAPSFETMYWHYGQMNLRAAHAIRRADGVYSIYCSNYACGPDSFNLHFYAYAMENKPFALIETDGHSGDAGTRTRIEAFLYCVEGDRRVPAEDRAALPRRDFRRVEEGSLDFGQVLKRGDLMLIPPMGQSASAVGAVFRSAGFRTEMLAASDRNSLALGRRYTSGKECLPMVLTAGALLRRVEEEPDDSRQFAFFMPTNCGPCRFGTYNLLHKIILERTELKDRVRVVSPPYDNYFEGLAEDLSMRIWIGTVAMDLLYGALLDVRPVEKEAGAASKLFTRYRAEMLDLLERTKGGSLIAAFGEARRGMFGVRDLVRRAARDFAAIKDFGRQLPTVAVVGEIYVRLDPFANDFVIDQLESHGLRARVADTSEWIEFSSWGRDRRIFEGRDPKGRNALDAWLSGAVQQQIGDRLYADMSGPLQWPARTKVVDSIATARPYVNDRLESETLLTVGGPLHEFLEGDIDGVVSVGPLECMPNKIAESHLLRVESDFGLPSATLSLNGDPIDRRVLEAFVYDVKERANRRASDRDAPHALIPRSSLGPLAWRVSGRAAANVLGMLPLRGASPCGGCGSRPNCCESLEHDEPNVAD